MNVQSLLPWTSLSAAFEMTTSDLLKSTLSLLNETTNSALYDSSIKSNQEKNECMYSRKVFVGGLPPDINESILLLLEQFFNINFCQFGSLRVDWPHKSEAKSKLPPKGYAFLIFDAEESVKSLLDKCFRENNRIYTYISSKSLKDKLIQIRSWSLTDTNCIMSSLESMDPRKTIFVGGVPRPLTASNKKPNLLFISFFLLLRYSIKWENKDELATIMNGLFGGVVYAAIDIDSELKYPKGAGRVTFSNRESYEAAIKRRFVTLKHDDIDKRAEMKPYVFDNQICDNCQVMNISSNRIGPYFCSNISCLKYFCQECWSENHKTVGKDSHKPLVKKGNDRPRLIQFHKLENNN